MDLKPKTLLRRVFDFAKTELERRSRPPSTWPGEASAQAQPAEPLTVHEIEPHSPVQRASERPTPAVLDVSRTHEGVWRVQWTLGHEDVERSEALAGEQAVLCLRLVSFQAGRDDVRREVLDRPFVNLTGSCDLGSSELHGVVSVGLRAGERFVSIVHHIV